MLSTDSKMPTAVNSSWRAAQEKPLPHSESLRISLVLVAGCYISCHPSDSFHKRCVNGQNSKPCRIATSEYAPIQGAGRTTEDASLLELEIPVTTDEIAISEALQKNDEDNMRVVFCTYHSLPKVEETQDAGAPAFDIILCDEGHRTTGIERSSNDDKTSPFVLVHDADRIRANKRLYMTATPRLYTESAKAKAAQHKIDVFSMDDPKTYGPEFHHLPFSKAVERDPPL